MNIYNLLGKNWLYNDLWFLVDKAQSNQLMNSIDIITASPVVIADARAKEQCNIVRFLCDHGLKLNEYCKKCSENGSLDE